MAEHTPGPWQIEKNGSAFNVWNPDRSDKHHMILLGMTYNAPGEHAANAHLIAAAPDLLWLAENLDRYNALQAKRDVGADDRGGLASFEKEFIAKYDQRKRAAITKARGTEEA